MNYLSISRVGINQTELVARFENGSNTDECIRSLETIILFECDPNADWDEVAVAGDVSSYFLEFIIDFEDPCSVSLTNILLLHEGNVFMKHYMLTLICHRMKVYILTMYVKEVYTYIHWAGLLDWNTVGLTYFGFIHVMVVLIDPY